MEGTGNRKRRREGEGGKENESGKGKEKEERGKEVIPLIFQNLVAPLDTQTPWTIL